MKTTKISPHKSSIGVDANWMSLIMLGGEILIGFIPFGRYVSWGVPLVFFFVEKKSKFVKFQAATLLVIEIIDAIIYIVFRIIMRLMYPRTWAGVRRFYMGGGGIYSLLYTLEILCYIFFLVLAVIFVWNAVKWKQAEVPVIGPLAVKVNEKLDTINGKKGGKKQSGASGSGSGSKAKSPAKRAAKKK